MNGSIAQQLYMTTGCIASLAVGSALFLKLAGDEKLIIVSIYVTAICSTGEIPTQSNALCDFLSNLLQDTPRPGTFLPSGSGSVLT